MTSPAARIALLILALGCEPAPATDAAQGHGPGAVPLVHDVFGVPGPWWRAGATPDEFAAEMAACRRVSREARERAGGGDPLDAAYRSFLECMEKRGWNRGIPPQAALQRPRIATE